MKLSAREQSELRYLMRRPGIWGQAQGDPDIIRWSKLGLIEAKQNPRTGKWGQHITDAGRAAIRSAVRNSAPELDAVALDQATRAYLSEIGTNPDLPQGLEPGSPSWADGEREAIGLAIQTYLAALSPAGRAALAQAEETK